MTIGEWILICGYCVMVGYFWRVIESAIEEAKGAPEKGQTHVE